MCKAIYRYLVAREFRRAHRVFQTIRASDKSAGTFLATTLVVLTSLTASAGLEYGRLWLKNRRLVRGTLL